MRSRARKGRITHHHHQYISWTRMDTKMRECKMAELKFGNAPLAKFETEEWVDFHDHQNSEDLENSNKDTTRKTSIESNDNTFVDNSFGETFSGSLEDLVNTFDEKITKCFINYEDKVEKFAPVQVRSQEEIMNECQMWWTITGNFGNILPIDWSKSYARQLHMPALNLNDGTDRESGHDQEDSQEDDEDVAKDLDLHSLIISSLHQEPMFTAEDVLEEIDEIMQESTTCEDLQVDDEQDEVANKRPHTLELSGRAAVEAPLYEEKLKSLTMTQMNELYVELEMVVKELSETLIQELALRDELEYEKELKNSFISLLLSVQNKRRQCNLEKKKKVKLSGLNGLEPKVQQIRAEKNENVSNEYLTTVIPYHKGEDSRSVQTLQILIKILQAINEDSPTVPTLLTDFILKGGENSSKLVDATGESLSTSEAYILIDIGANLTNKKFARDLDSVIRRAKDAGVQQMIVTGTSVHLSKEALRLTQMHPGTLFCTAGVHPHEAKSWDEHSYSSLQQIASSPECVAIGECGLDFNRNYSPPDIQMEVCEKQIQLACYLKKPLFLHVRDAHKELISILDRYKHELPEVVVHCFTEERAEAEAYLAMGFYIGITGYIWKDKSSDGVRSLLESNSIPLDHLMVETDAPFMYPNTRASKLPTHIRDQLSERSLSFLYRYCTFQRNEPCSLPITVELIAAYMKRKPEEVAVATTYNALKVFGLC